MVNVISYQAGLAAVGLPFTPVTAFRDNITEWQFSLLGVDLTGATLTARLNTTPDSDADDLALMTAEVSTVKDVTWEQGLGDSVSLLPSDAQLDDVIQQSLVTLTFTPPADQATLGVSKTQVGGNLLYFWAVKASGGNFSATEKTILASPLNLLATV